MVRLPDRRGGHAHRFCTRRRPLGLRLGRFVAAVDVAGCHVPRRPLPRLATAGPSTGLRAGGAPTSRPSRPPARPPPAFQAVRRSVGGGRRTPRARGGAAASRLGDAEPRAPDATSRPGETGRRGSSRPTSRPPRGGDTLRDARHRMGVAFLGTATSRARPGADGRVSNPGAGRRRGPSSPRADGPSDRGRRNARTTRPSRPRHESSSRGPMR